MDFYPSLTSSALSIACHLASNSVLTFYSNAMLVRMAIVAMWALGFDVNCRRIITQCTCVYCKMSNLISFVRTKGTFLCVDRIFLLH